MSANTIGADHHQSAGRVLDRLAQCFGRSVRGFRFQTVLDLWFDQPPVAVKCGHFVGLFVLRPVGALPACPIGIALRVTGRVVHIAEEILPAFRNRTGVLGIGRLHLLKIGCISAIQKRAAEKLLVFFAALAVFGLSVVCSHDLQSCSGVFIFDPAASKQGEGHCRRRCRFVFSSGERPVRPKLNFQGPLRL